MSENPLTDILNEALESSEIAWWEWDFKKNKVISNDLKTTMLGYKPGSFKDVGYQAYTDLLHPDDYERTMQAMRDHLEGRAPIYQIDYRIKKADGNYTWYMDRGVIIERGKKGNPLKLRGIVLNLGEEIIEKARDKAVFEMVRKSLPSGIDHGKSSIVICSSCKKIKIDKDKWMEIDESFEKSFPMEISHSICKPCIKILYPDEAEELFDD